MTYRLEVVWKMSKMLGTGSRGSKTSRVTRSMPSRVLPSGDGSTLVRYCFRAAVTAARS